MELGDAGHHIAPDAGLGRDHLVPFQAHDLFHGFHGKALRGARVFGHQQDIEAGARRASHHLGQVDHRNHLAADIGHAEHGRAAADHGGDLGHYQDFADLEDVDAEQFALRGLVRLAQAEQQQLELVVVGQVGPFVDVSHRAAHTLPLSPQCAGSLRGVDRFPGPGGAAWLQRRLPWSGALQ